MRTETECRNASKTKNGRAIDLRPRYDSTQPKRMPENEASIESKRFRASLAYRVEQLLCTGLREKNHISFMLLICSLFGCLHKCEQTVTEPFGERKSTKCKQSENG